jgi:hypothetical protein
VVRVSVATAPIDDTARDKARPEWSETHEKSVSGCFIKIE